MPTTRKKVIKAVYKDENSDEETGDFSDSGSEAKISEVSSSEDEEIEYENSSADEFQDTSKNYKTSARKGLSKKPMFAKSLVKKIHKQTSNEDNVDTPVLFSVKDLTDADKLLPSILNLSESDSSDDESPQPTSRNNSIFMQPMEENNDSDNDIKAEYKDVWSNNMQVQDNSEEIAKKTFKELEQHKSNIEETKAALQKYTLKIKEQDSDVKDLLAMGEEISTPVVDTIRKKPKFKRQRDDSDSEIEDWEEVKETKEIPQQGIQLFVEFPDTGCRKKKKLDVEMMMKRRMNRVKKEYQVFMHKVHVLCWLGHGNYISRILNDQELMSATLTLVPSKECYPGERVDMKYVEHIATWYRDKLTLKQDKHEDKFKPKAPPLKNILLDLIKRKVVTTNKYLVFIFVIMLRALGLQCRVMFNFVTLPIKPPVSELCSLSTKPKDNNSNSETASANKAKASNTKEKSIPKASTSKIKPKAKNIAQIDGNYDSHSNDDDDDDEMRSDDGYILNENIMQIDGNDDSLNGRRTRSCKRLKADALEKLEEEDVSPPKIQKKGGKSDSSKPTTKANVDSGTKRTQRLKKTIDTNEKCDQIDNSLKTQSSDLKASPRISKRVQKSQIENSKRNELPSTGKSTDTANISNTKCDETDSINLKASPRTSKRVQKSQIENNKHNELPRTVKSKDITNISNTKCDETDSINLKVSPRTSKRVQKSEIENSNHNEVQKTGNSTVSVNINTGNKVQGDNPKKTRAKKALAVPNICITDENNKDVASKFFKDATPTPKFSRLTRKRSQTTNPEPSKCISKMEGKGEKEKILKTKGRTKSAPGTNIEKSKYFEHDKTVFKTKIDTEDKQRISHRDLTKKTIKKDNNDVTGDLINIMKNRIKNAKLETKKGLVKGKIKTESDEDSDFLPVENSKGGHSEDEFKPKKNSPKPRASGRRIDRRVISPDEEPTNKKGIDVWCEIFVEELEQWIAVDVVKGKIHSVSDIYRNATHPVCYVVAWDNNNYLKDLTRKYVPHYNTVTRKLRAETLWWEKSVQPYLGPKTARDREEDEYLNRMQLEAPLPKSITEYKNHPLYALTRHLLKFEAIYPPDAAALGFVRGEPVYARECVYVCRSRDKWLKEAKVVKLGEKPYKVVKARPKWDRLSNKLITDKPLEVFGPWQVQDYEPPVAENGIVPRNAYGNVELFKQCMLPKGTVHIKLPSLNRVARKLNIDCAPAMTGFDFNGGWSHPVYDGFVVCEEFEEIVTEAWVKDQEEQERREREKIELRVYGNWKRLIKGLMIRERLKNKYGFEEPTTLAPSKGKKGPKLVVKKK